MKKVVMVLVSVILVIGVVLGIRYGDYYKVMGSYHVVNDVGMNNTKNLKLDLYSWQFGLEKDLECDMWGCNGYKSGYYYEIKDGNIYFKFKDGVIESKIKLKDNYLIIDDVVYQKD